MTYHGYNIMIATNVVVEKVLLLLVIYMTDEWAMCYLDLFERKKKTGRFDSVKSTGRDFEAIGAHTWFL